MSEQVQEIYLVTDDAAWKQAMEELLAGEEDVHLRHFSSGEEVRATQLKDGWIFIDEGLEDTNAFILCRALRRSARHRIAMLSRGDLVLGSPIGRFCGAGVTIAFPESRRALLPLLRERAPALPVEEMLRRSEQEGEDAIRQGVLRDLERVSSGGVLDSITDPETKLFNYPFLLFKLDEEYKRAVRFKFPLACVMFGFDGEADEQVLLELAGIFLNESRDTDVLGRFDLNSFLFLLPNTGPDGASAMAERVLTSCSERGLKDLTGDLLQISVGISYFPHAEIERREHLYERARRSFLEVRDDGGGVRVAD